MRKSSIKPAHPPIWHPTKEYQWNKAATKDGTLPKRRKFLLLISFSTLSTRRKVVYLDISKAFDTVNHVILWKNWRTSVYQFLHSNGSFSEIPSSPYQLCFIWYITRGQWCTAGKRSWSIAIQYLCKWHPTVCQIVQPRATWMTPSFYCLLPWTTLLVL